MQSPFHRRAQRNAFGRHDARQPRRSFAPRNPQLKRSPIPSGFAEIVCDDLPVFHAGRALMRAAQLPQLAANSKRAT